MVFSWFRRLVARPPRPATDARWRKVGDRVHIEGDCVIDGDAVYINGVRAPELDGRWLRAHKLTVSGDLSNTRMRR